MTKYTSKYRKHRQWWRWLPVALLAFGLGAVVFETVAASFEPKDYRASAEVTPAATPTASPTAATLRLAGVQPQSATAKLSPSASIRIRFSTALQSLTSTPKLSPAVPGTWTVSGSTLVFRPTGHLPLFSTVRVTVAAGTRGPQGTVGSQLAQPVHLSFQVGGPQGRAAVLRLQQLLAELGYLPLTFTPTRQASASPSPTPSASVTPGTVSASSSSVASRSVVAQTTKASGLASEPRSAALVATAPASGTFSWRYGGVPATLRRLWQRGKYTVMVKGAVMAFEADHGLNFDGVAGAQVWRTLLQAVAQRHTYGRRYSYILVSRRLPESLAVWQAGKVIYRTSVNTGVAAAPTETGTFPVYARYASTTMSGTNPDGSHYSDPGVPYVAYFNGGDAVHGFQRASYGYPQSLGCVELPYSAAAKVFAYDPIGTLVTVQ